MPNPASPYPATNLPSLPGAVAPAARSLWSRILPGMLLLSVPAAVACGFVFLFPTLAGDSFLAPSAIVAWLALGVVGVLLLARANTVGGALPAPRRAGSHARREMPASSGVEDCFFRMSFDMLCIAGFDGYFRRLNPAWETTLGWSRDDLLKRPYLDFVHPDDRAATVAAATGLAAGTAAVSFENRYRCRDGTYRWLEWTAAPDSDSGLIYAVARDRTGQKNDEAEIRRTRLFLDSVVENIPNMVFVKDTRDLRFVLFNRAGEVLLGYPRAELIGKNDYDFFPEDQASFFAGKDREVLAGKRLVEIPEEPLRTKGGEVRYLHTRKLPLLDEHGEPRYLLGISEDITEHKLVDAAKSEFVGLASHQLRTPLTGIRWTLELLQGEPAGLSDDQRKLIDDAHAAAVQLAESIGTMLRVSRIEAHAVRLNCVEVALEPFLERLRSEYAPLCAKKRQTLSVSCPPRLALRTDPQLLGEVVGNLVSNAVKYTPEGGVVRMEARDLGEGGVEVAVADTGIGIPPGEREKVFTKLFRAANAVSLDPGGTGLGLYVASSLTRLLGGTLTFESEEGLGTTFRLRLFPLST